MIVTLIGLIRSIVLADPADVGAANGAALEDDDAIVLDVNDFTTWDPETFALVPFDKILFPTDPYTSICSVRSYLAVAMIMWYDTDIRAAHSKSTCKCIFR